MSKISRWRRGEVGKCVDNETKLGSGERIKEFI